jgi:hypothetical protein
MAENATGGTGRAQGPVVRSEFADADGDETHDLVPDPGRSGPVGHGHHDAGSRVPRSDPEAVDLAYREWARNRSDLDALRRLRDAIGKCLEGDAPAQDTESL